MFAGGKTDEDNAWHSVGTSVTFGEEWDIPVANLEAVRQHGWQVTPARVCYNCVLAMEGGLPMNMQEFMKNRQQFPAES